MTVSTSANKVIWQGNGATTVFTYSFPIPNTASVVVTYTDAGGNQTTISPSQYTITGVGSAGGGTVTYPISGSPIAGGTSLTLERFVPYTQPESLANQGGLWPTAIEQGGLDNLEYQIQQLAEQIARAIVLNPTDITSPSPLPPAALRAGQALMFDSNGQPIVSAFAPTGVPISGVMQPVVAAATAFLAAAAMNVIPNISNIAALRALSAASVPAAVFVAGYYTTSDGGEGAFTYVASDTTSSDNGGTIIVDAAGHRWYRGGCSNEVTAKQFGAKCDGATNDAPALQAMINFAQSGTVRKCIIDAGSCLLNAGLIVTGNGLIIEGDSTFDSNLVAGSGSITPITFTGGLNCTLRDIGIVNSFLPTTGVANIFLNGSVETNIINVFSTGGYYGLYGNGASSCMIERSRIYNATLHQCYLLSSSCYFHRVDFDMAWPNNGTASASNDKGNWTATHAYNAGDFVRSNGQYWQAVQSGTTASVAPTTSVPQTRFTDGTVIWQAAGATSGSLVVIDSFSNSNFFYECDLTGAALNGMLVQNTIGGGIRPTYIVVDSCVVDLNVNAGFSATDGAGFILRSSRFTGTVLSGGGTGILVGTVVPGDIAIHNNLIFGNNVGIALGGGVGTVISNNVIVGNVTDGILVGAGVTQFIIEANRMGSSAEWGANANSIVVSVGASDYYNIANNLVVGSSSSGVSDGGSGTHKSVSGNL